MLGHSGLVSDYISRQQIGTRVEAEAVVLAHGGLRQGLQISGGQGDCLGLLCLGGREAPPIAGFEESVAS